MTIPTMFAPAPSFMAPTEAVLAFPGDALLGAMAALTLLAAGVSFVAVARISRGARQAAIPTSAAA